MLPRLDTVTVDWRRWSAVELQLRDLAVELVVGRYKLFSYSFTWSLGLGLGLGLAPYLVPSLFLEHSFVFF